MLENKWHAMLLAVVLAMLSYTAWLSVSVIALVSLRRGWRDGAWLLIPATTINIVLALTYSTPTIAVINALLTFVPCYLAACGLRFIASWRLVAVILFIQIAIAVSLVQMFLPEFMTAQYVYFQHVLREMHTDGALFQLIDDKTGLNQIILTSYLLGLQAVGVALSAVFSLMLARSVQSQLFNPGGFRQEMLTFQGEKLGLLLLVITLVMANHHNVLAMSTLPAIMFYFLLAGLSLAANVLVKKKPLVSLLLLTSAFLVLPFIMIPVCILFGSLDSLFNFRFYLPSDASKTI